MKQLRNTKPKTMIREGENTVEPKPENKEVETKQFPHNHTEV